MILKYLMVSLLRLKLRFPYNLPILLVSIKLMYGLGKSAILNWQPLCLNKLRYMPSMYLIMSLRLPVNIRSLFLSLKACRKNSRKRNSRLQLHRSR
ncbi:hypothetical protein CF124_03045 [Aeromonas hydrophila]|nr:hypothetical protein CF124_03045 [Aeromonas hydrophila]